jgi:hypothetical protein
MNQLGTTNKPIVDGSAYRAGIGLRWGRCRVRSCAAVAAVVAAVGASGVPQAVALAGASPALTWTRQSPAAGPPARWGAPMAYDAATGTVVLFGGATKRGSSRGTWTWDGSTWAKQSPAASPPALFDASMAYDAATGTVVLFGGGTRSGSSRGTWTWNGSTWARQSPAASPPARSGASMAYDAATGTVVLFGGTRGAHSYADTWTWDGSSWTKQSPAASPPKRLDASMAYDAATGTVILFGGRLNADGGVALGDTWAWNGSAWTQQHPTASPTSRWGGSMAYDAATDTVVLFGGFNNDQGPYLNDTWLWNGTAWTRQHPAASPPTRAGASMAYDAATRAVVLFGGDNGKTLDDTWTWGSS